MGKKAKRRQARRMAQKGKSAEQIQRRTGVSQSRADRVVSRVSGGPSPATVTRNYTPGQSGSRMTRSSSSPLSIEMGGGRNKGNDRKRGGGGGNKAREKLRDSRQQVQDLSGQVTSMQEELDYLYSGGLEQTEDPYAIDFESFFADMAAMQEQQAMAFAEQMDAVYAGIEEQMAALSQEKDKEVTQPEGTRGGFKTTDTDAVETTPEVDTEATTDDEAEDTTGLAIGGSGTATEEETSPLSIGV